MDHKPKKTKEVNLVCTCDEKYATIECPVHPGKQKKDIELDINEMIVTDNEIDLGSLPKGITFWEGHAFKCLKCKKPAILHFHNYCSNCGQKVKIQSKIVTNYIRKNRGG